MSPDRLKQLLNQSPPASFTSELDVLTEPELEVFSTSRHGCSTSQIEAEIGVAPPELRDLKQRIRKKLGLKTEAEVVRKAMAHVNS